MLSSVEPTQAVSVFVYGSLKPGELYYLEYCEGKVVAQQAAIAYGQLYDLPMGYPAMTLGEVQENQIVHGVLFTFADSSALVTLDELEGYVEGGVENEYDRVAIEVFTPTGESLGMAWVYVMTPEQVRQLNGVNLPNGYWSGKNQS